MTTEEYLLKKGFMFQSDPIQYRDVKKGLITEAVRTLLKLDYGTQDLISQYVNHYFESFNYNLNSRDHMERSKAAELHYSQLGWTTSKRLAINDDRLDEVCYLFAYTSMLGSVPVSPGDVTMNTFRYYDALRLIMGGNHDNEDSFLLTDETEPVTAYVRFKYFSFIAQNLKQYLLGFNMEEIVGALYHSSIYQLAPVMAAAFRIYERDNSHSSIRIAWPVLETKEWTELTLIDLLHQVNVDETPEWMKVIPLVDDSRAFLRSKLGDATIPLPVETIEDSGTELLKQMKMFGLYPKINASILEYFDSQDYGWLLSLAGLQSIKDYKSYINSYNVSVKGYYLAEDQLPDDVTLLEIYKEGLFPSFDTLIGESFGSTAPGMTLSINPDMKRVEKNLSIVKDLIKNNETQIFRSVLDYSERRILINSSLLDETNNLPLYYSFTGGRISFDTNSEG